MTCAGKPNLRIHEMCRSRIGCRSSCWPRFFVSGLNGAANSVSFRSVNFPTMYLAPCPASQNLEAGRICLLDRSTITAADDATFTVASGLSDPSLYSFVSQSAAYSGYYVTFNNKLQGTCASWYSAPTSDVVLEAVPEVAQATWCTCGVSAWG